MSMNFGREQALLRQRLQAAGSPAVAAERQSLLPGATFLGASDDDVRQAATDLANTYPQMGRAQMTAFVRTLWQSKIHELRTVGVELLAQRAALLEPADLPFVEKLLADDVLDPVARRLATDVLGAMVDKSKKLWKDLRRLAADADARLKRAALRGSCLPARADADAFPRFLELAEPMLATADAELLVVLDEVLGEIAEAHHDAVVAFAAQHGRKPKLPKKAKKPATSVLQPKAAAKKSAVTKPATKPATKKVAKKTASKASTRRAR